MIPIAMPLLAEDEADAAREAVLSGWVSQGPQVAAFEREFAALVDAPHACAVSNCTTALHLALTAANIAPGDEVITASHSFIATANCIRYCGATPVFVDIDPETYNIDPDRVAEAITPRTRAILAIHQMGMPCDLGALVALAKRHDLTLIEDAACAAGSQIRIDEQWGRIGKPHGDIACFSFHPRKVITTGEGGMVTVSDEQLQQQLRLQRFHGIERDAWKRYGKASDPTYDIIEPGFKYNMTDVQAALGLCQLKRAEEHLHAQEIDGVGRRVVDLDPFLLVVLGPGAVRHDLADYELARLRHPDERLDRTLKPNHGHVRRHEREQRVPDRRAASPCPSGNDGDAALDREREQRRQLGVERPGTDEVHHGCGRQEGRLDHPASLPSRRVRCR